MRKVNIEEPGFRYDPEDPEGFRSGMFRPREELEPKLLGASVYELPPGQSLCPYHYEYAEEEWLLVLRGAPTVRTPEGEERLEEMDLTLFPRGPEGAHEVRNNTSETVRVLMFSNHESTAATVYPDSDKIGIWTGNKDDDLMVRRTSGVPYFDGESRGGSAE